MTTPATDGQAPQASAGASSLAEANRIRTRSGIASAGASSIAVGEAMPRGEDELTTREPDQALAAFADWTLYRVFDGAFAKGPKNGVGTVLDEDDPDRRMDYWSGPFAVSGAAATCTYVEDTSFPSGRGIEVAFAASAVAEDVYFEQTFPLAGSYFHIAGGILRAAGTRLAGTGLSTTIELDYMGFDDTIYDSDSQTASCAVIWQHYSDQSAPARDGRVRKVRLRLHVQRSLGAAGTPGTVRLSDVRFDELRQFVAISGGDSDPMVLRNDFGSLGVSYQGSSYFAVSPDPTEPAGWPAGIPATWSQLPLAISLMTAPDPVDSASYAIYPKTDGKLYGYSGLSAVERRLDNVVGTDVQAFDSDLSALAALASTGLAARTGSGTWSTRTLTAPAAGITITNPGGVAGNPTLALANDLEALEALASTGIAVRTGTDTWAQRSLVAPSDGLTITNPGGASGAPTFALADDLAGLEAVTGTGIVVRTAANTYATRSVVSPNPGLVVSQGDGVAGSIGIFLERDVAALEALTGTGHAVRTGVETWALYSLPDVQSFSADGTWTKPTGATICYVWMIGAGGGGGAGRRGAAGSARTGGGGGGGGACSEAWIPAASLGATIAVTVGTAGSGAAAQNTNDTNGANGTAGGDSIFGGIRASGGAGGTGGGAGGAGGGGAGGSTYGTRNGATGGNGSTNAPTNGGSTGITNLNAGAGAGGGGAAGITVGDVSGTTGGDGGGIYLTTAVGTGASTTGPTGAGAGQTPVMYAGGTGGGGGVNATGARSGTGGGRGAGGGGGAASTNGTNSGAGGNGGAGFVVIVSY